MNVRKLQTEATTYLMQVDPTRMKDVPSNAVKMRNMKKATRFGASAVPMLQTKNRAAVVRLMIRRPYTWLRGPQNMGDRPMNNTF